MNRRKLQRAKRATAARTDKRAKIVTHTAEKTAAAAVKGQATIDCIGNFIFFSTPHGKAWVLDHRQNLALRLADNRKIRPYRIIESQERLQIEWKERFRIEGDSLYISDKITEEVVDDCPVDAIEHLISALVAKKSETLK